MSDIILDKGRMLDFVSGPLGIFYGVGRSGVVRIVVRMENGQGAAVPWALVIFDDDRTTMVNLAHVYEVGFPKQETSNE